MEEELPSDVDVIVVGTGMPECILAAAHARNGKQVLHIDINEYYGGSWATFNFDGFEKWMRQAQESEVSKDSEVKESFDLLLKEGEVALPCAYNNKLYTNVSSHAADTEESKEYELSSQPNLEQAATAGSMEDPSEVPTTSSEGSLNEIGEKSTSDNPEMKVSENASWSMSRIRSLYRKFNLDLAPKLLFSRGELVDLLISSNIARYAEFKSVSRVLSYLNGKLEQVPCSRSDVFSTKNVSIVEKRMLMKLLTFCLKFEEQPDEYKGFEGRPFVDFLKSHKLTPNVEHYVLHAIAMVPNDATTLEGLKATRRFLQSLGRYGNTPFLWPLYGSGELPQCFCRLCAVFGGVYCLKRKVDAVVVDAERSCTGIISNGKRLNCRWLVMDANFAPRGFLPDNFGERGLSRAIILTNKSVLPADKEQLTFLRLPPGDELQTAVWIIELGPGSMACPSGLYVVHLTSLQVADAETDLQPVVNLIFGDSEKDEQQGAAGGSDKPKIVFSAYFNQADSSTCDLNIRRPENVLLTSSPGAFPDFDSSVNEARELFNRSFPDEEFLPRAPDPEEIIIGEIDDCNGNPGISQGEPQSIGNDSLVNEDSKREESGEGVSEVGVKEDSTVVESSQTKDCVDHSETVQKEE